MRIVLFICLILGNTLGYAQDLNKKLEKIIQGVDTYYEKAQPYSLVLSVVSANYHNNKVIQDTKNAQKYKMVIGNHFMYSYLNTSQVFNDSLGELIIDNQKQIIEFNNFRTYTPQTTGQSILNVAKSLGTTIQSIKQDGGKTKLLFTDDKGLVEVEYELVNNQIIEITHRNFGDDKQLLYTLNTTYSEIKSNLTKFNKYKMQGHGRITDDEFVPNAKYSEYEIFNY